MRTLILTFIAALLITNPVHADTYHRFWRGIILPSLDLTNFVNDLNQVFIPDTVHTGAGKGLIAYEPFVSQGLKDLPDEIALVSYESKTAYDTLFSTDAGKAYQNLHWQYFDQSLSHSLTPEPFLGSVGIEQAYDFHPTYSQWKENQTTVFVFYRQTAETDADFLSRANQHLQEALANDQNEGIQDRAILVSQNYWIEYVSANAAVTENIGTGVGVHLSHESVSNPEITAGSGINLQF